MKPKPLSINLVREKKSFLDTFIKWALTVGRFLVITTETIALLAFVYRFSLDRELVDLHDTIKSKQTLLSISKDNEAKYRNLQNRLSLSSTFMEKGANSTALFKKIIVDKPSDLVLNTVALSDKQIKIGASAQSIPAVSKLVETLKSYPEVSSVSVDRIENKTSSALIVISITLDLRNK